MACSGLFSHRHELLFCLEAGSPVAGIERGYQMSLGSFLWFDTHQPEGMKLEILPSIRNSQYISPKLGIERQRFTNFPQQPFNSLIPDSRDMMSRIKQIAIAAIAVSGILSLVVVAPQLATAQNLIDTDTLTQSITDEVDQEIEQEAEQEAEQEQEQEQENEQSAEQSNEATVSQDEENNQANVLTTGDNTASTTQVGSNDAIGNEVEAESEGGDSGDAKAKKYSKASSTGGDAGDAEAELEQEVENTATTIQDSSANDNILSNENTFGDDVAIVDQDNTADQDAINVGIQDQDLDQTIDQVQDAVNANIDFDFQYGFQLDED